MATAQDLIDNARTVIGADVPIEAVSVVALADNYGTITASGAGTGALQGAIGLSSPWLDGLFSLIGLKAARTANARRQGASERMLLVVTTTQLRLLSLPGIGFTAGDEVKTFDRASTKITTKRWGRMRKLLLSDAQGEPLLQLSCTPSGRPPYGEGARAVLAALGQ